MDAQPAANKAGTPSRKAAGKAPNVPAGKAGFPLLFTASGGEPPHPGDSDEDEDDFREEGKDSDAEEFEDDPVVDPLRPMPYCITCGNLSPEGPGANFFGVCGTNRPAPANTSPPGNAAAAASSAGSSAPGSAGQAARQNEQGSTSQNTKKVREDKLVKQREIQHFRSQC